MALNYIINWTDPSLKAPFILQRGSIDIDTTSLTLVSEGVNNWPNIIQQNLVRLLERFASDGVEPVSPTPGQLWYDVSINELLLRTQSAGWVTVWPPCSGYSPNPVGIPV